MKFLERALDGKNQWWKYVLTFIAAFFGGQLTGSIPLFAVMAIKLFVADGPSAINSESLLDFTAGGMSKNFVFGLMMLAPLTVLAFTIILVKALHRRTFSETVNGRISLRWNRVIFAFFLWFAVMAAYTAVDYALNSDNYVLQFDLKKFIVLFALSAILVPLQATSEELLMRGYLAQGIGAGTKSRWLAWIIPSLIFGFLHIGNPEVATYGFALSMTQYLFFGLFFGLVAVVDDGIELSMGMHIANNLFLCLFITHSASALQTDAVFSLKEINPVTDIISLIIISSVVFILLRIKYSWNLGVMNQKIAN